MESTWAHLTRAIYSRFKTDFVYDGDLLQTYITLPTAACQAEVLSMSGTVFSTSGTSVILRSLDEKSRQHGDELIILYLRTTTIKESYCDPLAWWKVQESRLHIFKEFSRNILPVQATSAVSESFFSEAGDLISDNRGLLLDDAIRSNMRVQPCN